jgi:predicted O-methyltransferase YrrM
MATMLGPLEAARKLYSLAEFIRLAGRINMAYARAAATAPLRHVDPTRPATWGFSGFSQNNEDGITEYLLAQLREPNRYFIEIGASDGVENNTAWLALARRYSGLMIDGNKRLARRGQRLLRPLALGVRVMHLFVDRDTAPRILEAALRRDPDFLSLDIDGNDYYVAQALFGAGLRPRVCVVEYNASFGPDLSVTIAYRPDFNYMTAHPDRLYWGASITAWRKFFTAHGYHFLTVEPNGANAYFVDPGAFDTVFLDHVRGDAFQENFEVLCRLGKAWPDQLAALRGMDLVPV